MAIAAQGLQCQTCGRQTMHVPANRINHVLHFLIGLLTCSVWWFAWLFMVVTHESRYACTVCGTLYSHPQALAAWEESQGLTREDRSRRARADQRRLLRGVAIAGGVIALVFAALVGIGIYARPASPPPAVTSARSSAPVSTSSGNPAHDRLWALSDFDQAEAFRKILKGNSPTCDRVNNTLFQGFTKEHAAHWSVRCKNGAAFMVAIDPDATGSTKVMDCRLLAKVGGRCFQRYPTP